MKPKTKPETNKDRLVAKKVLVRIAPSVHYRNFGVDSYGNSFSLPGTGGITTNILVGDPVFGWQGDHIEPGVVTIGAENSAGMEKNSAYYFLPCIGNEVEITSGNMKGRKGIVTGKHGGANHIIVDFPNEVIDRLTMEEKMIITTIGQGLKFVNYPKIIVMNIAPALLRLMAIEEKKGCLCIPVKHIIPSFLIGSGMGSVNMGLGDIDLMANDESVIREFKLESLKLGDIVAIQDLYCEFGASYIKGACSIGIVVHCDSLFPGHGPGLTIFFTDKNNRLLPQKNKSANVGILLDIGRFRVRGTR